MKMLQISNTLGFPSFVQWVKIKYLGLPLTLGASLPSLWLDVLSKLKAKIVSLGGHWLTKAWKLVLIKSVLSSLPIFQSSLLLAPKFISIQIAKILRDFLWSWGKGNQNKIHLVKWETIKRPITEGGLQIRDHELANLALGVKLVWQIFADKNHPVSKLFSMKYLKGGSLRTIKLEKLPTCTAIWNLCRKSINLIEHHLYRIPSNGKGFFFWEDMILGDPPLSSINSLSEIKLWLSNKDLLHLADIWLWDDAGNWVDWNFPEMPQWLIPEQSILTKALSDLAPIHCSLKDKWGWGPTGVYSVGHGFSAIQSSQTSLLTPALWKSI